MSDGTSVPFTQNTQISPFCRQMVRKNEQVASFIEALQTTKITESIKIGPGAWYAITILGFMLPAIWSVIVLANASLPPKMFFDGCKTDMSNYSASMISKYGMPPANPTLYDCFMCDNRSYVMPDLSKSTEATNMRVTSITYSVAIALFAPSFYARLTLLEYVAMHLLPYGVIVISVPSCTQYLPVLLVTALFGVVAGLNVAAQKSYANYLTEMRIGKGRHCPADSLYPFASFQPTFDDNNPSLTAAAPTDAVGYLKAIAVIMVPFVPLILRTATAAMTTFSKLSLNDLMTDNDNSAAVFNKFTFEVDEDDLVKALKELAQRRPSISCGFHTFTESLLLFTCDTEHPRAPYFGFSWGEHETDVQELCTILESEKQLKPYKKKSKGAQPDANDPTAFSQPDVGVDGGVAGGGAYVSQEEV